MKNKGLILISLLLFSSCNNSDSIKIDIGDVRQELIIANQKIEKLQNQLAQNGDLIHIVFLNVKEGVDVNTVMNEIKKLEKIEEIQNLKLGPFQDVGDKRALQQYELAIEMSFESQDDYEDYQQHPIHVNLKEALVEYLDAPPATYDYIKS